MQRGTGPRRRLRPLGDALAVAPRRDDPAQHDGRVRQEPHVPRRWPVHVYIAVTPDDELVEALEGLIASSPSLSDSLELHSLLGSNEGDLHISLSKPLYVSSTQLDDLKVALTGIARESQSMPLSFASTSVLSNDDVSRHFLTLDVAQGYDELVALVAALDTQLARLGLPTYYSPAHFHASFAWALSSRVDEPSSPGVRDAMTALASEFTASRGSLLRTSRLVGAHLSLAVGKARQSWPLQPP